MTRLVVLCLLVGACGGRGDAEREGDTSYAAGRFAAAAASYEQAAGQGTAPARVLAKLGNAALRAGETELAVSAWRRLGEEDPSSRGEAVDGLELALRAAVRSGRAQDAAAAAAALRGLAPGRPVVWSNDAADPSRAGRDDLVRAMATAVEPRAVDSLLLAFGERAETEGDWETALGAYRGVTRRGETGLVQQGRVGVATAATRLGSRSLAEGQPAEAVGYFREALAADPTAAGDSALAGLARALAATNDTTASAPPDSAETDAKEKTH
jgi:tetratricopeptide (TPR) repeat protein